MVRTPKFVRLPEERPQSLLDAALDVFSTVGYRAARLEQVAEAAGVTKGTIYYYFDDKQDLLAQAVTARIGATLGGIAGVADAPHASAAEKLRAVLHTAWGRWTDPATAKMQRLIMGEIRLDFPELFEQAMQAGPMQLAQLVVRIIDEGKRTGELDPRVDSEAAAQSFVTGLALQAMLAIDFKERNLRTVEPDRLFDAFVGAVLHGVVARAGTAAQPARSAKRRPASKRAPR